MILPLEKLMVYGGNKYYFTKAAMKAVDKVANIRQYPQYADQNLNWKVVSNVLRLMVNDEIKMHIPLQTDEQE